MNIIINHSLMVPIYEQIVDQVKKLIRDGSLVENDALPSVRALSKELKISALTTPLRPKASPTPSTARAPTWPRPTVNCSSKSRKKKSKPRSSRPSSKDGGSAFPTRICVPCLTLFWRDHYDHT